MVRRLHLGLAVIIVVIVAAAAVLLVFGTGAVSVNGPTTLSISNTPTVVRIGGTQYVLTLHGQAPASSAAYIYIGRSPVFINPTLNVTLLLDNYTKINGNGTTYANMEIKLDSVSNSVVSITITPLQAYLAEPPDYGRIKVIGQVTSQGSSTTVSIATTSLSTTTTINQSAAAQQKFVAYLKLNQWYGLMANFTKQYQNTVNCTPLLYNNSFRKYYAMAPVVPRDYWNVSAITPYNIELNISNAGKGNWAATYTAMSHTAYTTGKVLVITVNLSTGDVLSINQTGAFQGLTFTQLQGVLLQAASIGNACGVDVAI